ncbi:MAG TPA: family 20 glycosylhydrolase, partial [Prevotella sp.]
MRKNIFILLLLCMQALTMTAANHSVDYNVIPLPQEVSFTSKAPFVLNASTVVVATGDEKMKANARFLADYIKEMTGIGVQMAEQKTKSSIRLVLDKKIANSEGYTIKVTDKEVLIAGKTPQGVFYGVQTLRKALPVEQNLTQVELPSVVIKDAPRFSYRGMMLDCSRHFLPLSFVKRYIDLIALHNMNTFHWHLTDDQGWRIEIKQYPKLTEIGSKRAETVLGRISDVY